MQVLKRSASRLGFTSISMTSQNAGQLQTERSEFDLILADVPCSCEGTARKNKGVFFLPEVYKNSQVSTQRFILKRTAEFCRPGTRIIYSTCTFAPEENEENVQWFLDKMEGRFKIVPVPEIKNFKVSPGLTEWRDQKFDSSMIDTVRIWPHHNDTGGFFVAVLEAQY